MTNTKSGKELIKQIEIHFIELEKYDENISNVMDRWVNFLKKAGEYTKEDMPSKLKEIPTITKALEVLENTKNINFSCFGCMREYISCKIGGRVMEIGLL